MKPRRTRTIRCEDDLWQRALDTASERGESLSAAVRAFLARYVARR